MKRAPLGWRSPAKFRRESVTRTSDHAIVKTWVDDLNVSEVESAIEAMRTEIDRQQPITISTPRGKGFEWPAAVAVAAATKASIVSDAFRGFADSAKAISTTPSMSHIHDAMRLLAEFSEHKAPPSLTDAMSSSANIPLSPGAGDW